MKQLVIILLAFVLVCSPLKASTNQINDANNQYDNNDGADYAAYIIPNGCTREKCPPIDDAWLTDNEDMLLIMKALREWYYTEDEHRKALFLNNDYMLLVNPFIFQVAQAEQRKTIYCTCIFEEYYLYTNSDMKKTLKEGWYNLIPFAVEYEFCEGQWIVSAISIPEPEEELIPGWGIGTQGMNGVTDEMIEMMSKSHHYDRCEDYIQQYLIHTNMTDTIVDRE